MGCVCSPEPPLAGERASNQRSDMAQPLIPTTTTSGKTGSQDAHSSSSHQECSVLYERVQVGWGTRQVLDIYLKINKLLLKQHPKYSASSTNETTSNCSKDTLRRSTTPRNGWNAERKVIRGVVSCPIFHNPDNKEILHSNVLSEALPRRGVTTHRRCL